MALLVKPATRRVSRHYTKWPVQRFFVNTNMRRLSQRVLILALLTLLTQPCLADSDAWSDRSRFWAATSALALANDWATTRDMTQRYGEGYYETNPTLGANPSQQAVDLHFAIAVPLIYIIADNLSDERRTLWLKTVTLIEAGVSLNNLRIGLHWRF